MAQMVERLNTTEEFSAAAAANRKLQDAAESLGLAIGTSVTGTRELGRQLRARAESFKQEKPLQLLGIFAGIAMAAGFATRVWRSSHNA
ncbi:MAG TPA: hypothetical protein VH350_07330 [Candidatus Sulfotelmatobacter sp.]|nr:hypothetical protein [Candidatus Sulfotelmatobacter sp.]